MGTITIKTISTDELKRKMEQREKIVVLNVLEPEGYQLGIIKGSKKIPYTQLEGRLKELDKKHEIITYCAGPICTASKMAAELLASNGYNVRAYEGGIKEWKEAKLPIE